MKIVFIGAGNVATHLSLAMHRAGHEICQVYSRTEASARALAERLQCAWTTDLKAVQTDADFYVFALKDAVLAKVITQIPSNNGFWIHTAGSMPMDVFRGFAQRYGVLYPLQTFSKMRNLDFGQIPCFIESDSSDNEMLLRQFTEQFSNSVQVLSSEKRKYLHLAAVFACNFTNHMYSIATQIVDEQQVSRRVLLPLIDETAAKIHELSPQEAQTGPALRYDLNVIDKQSAMIDDLTVRKLYELMSQHIHQTSKP